MAKSTYVIPIKLVYGKISKYSDMIFRRIPNNDKECCLYELHPYKGEPSEAQKVQREKFRLAMQAIKNLTEEEKAAYNVSFKTQKKRKTLRGYMIAMEREKLG